MRRLLLCLQVSVVAIALAVAPCHAQIVAPAMPTPPAAAAAPAVPPPAVAADDKDAAVGSVVLSPNSLGATLLVNLAEEAAVLGDQIGELAQAVTDFPQLLRWLTRVANDKLAQAAIMAASWRLVVVMGAALAVEALTRRLLRKLVIMLRHAAPEALPDELPETVQGLDKAERGQTEPVYRCRDTVRIMARRLMYILAALVLDVVPILVMAATGAAILTAGLAPTLISRLVIITVLNAYVIWAATVALLRAVLSPASARLRLFRLSTLSARSLLRDFAAIAAVAIGGYALLEDALLFGLFKAAHDALLKLVALVSYILFARLVLRWRKSVKRVLRAQDGATGLGAAVRNAVAGSWHRIVLFYLLVLWVVWALNVANGFGRLLHFMLALCVVAVLVGVVDVLSHLGLDRLLVASEGLDEVYPGVGRRVVLYHSLTRRLLNLVLPVLAVLGVLVASGLDVPGWFAAKSGGARLLGSLTNIVIVLLMAVLLWESANLAIERHLARLTREAQLSRSARLRTLLPILRTTLLVTVVVVAGLTVLSEIGVNIAPLLAGAGVVGLAIGFGSQKLVQDIITGLFLLLENAMQVGDYVTLGGLSGTVETLSIRAIRLRATDGSVHIVPFSAVTTVTNQTRDYAFAVIDVTVGVNEDPDRICDLLREIGAEIRAENPWRGLVLADLEVWGIVKFTDYSYDVKIRIKTLPQSRWAVMRELHRRIKRRFDERAIQSPMTSYRALGMETPVITTIIHDHE